MFAAAVVLFFCTGLWGSRRITSAGGFFHYPRVSSNVLSLTAANITVGSGLVYLITGGFQNGPLMYAVPLATGLGYYLLASFVNKVVPGDVLKGTNFLKGVDSKIERARGERSFFAPVTSLCLVIVFVLFLGLRSSPHPG